MRAIRQWPLISPDSIAQVRDRADILAVIGEAVPTLKRRGRSFVGLCPFHKEKSPSFHVNPDRGFFHCFGCKESGSVIDFVMKQEGATFPEAIRSLAERFNVTLDETSTPEAKDGADRLRRQKEEFLTVNELAAQYFEAELKEHALRDYALRELERRGLVPGTSPAVDDALQAFRIGYAPHGWDGLAEHLKRKGVSPIAAETVGLLVPRSSGTGHYDRFRHRLVFAVTDVQGKVVAFSGRALDDPPGEPAKEKPAKYINSPESPVYSKGNLLFGLYQARHAIRQEEEAILVEGNFDVVSLHARGFSNVVAPLGTAFTEEQAKLLRRFAPRALLLFDADLAGRKAVRLSRAPLDQAGVSAKVASLPEGQDPDDLVRNRGPEALKGILSGAKGMREYLIEAALDASFASADAFERAQRVDEVKALLRSDGDPMIGEMFKSYADMLASRLDLHQVNTFRALEESVRRDVSRAQPRGPSPREARITAPKPGTLERREIAGVFMDLPSLIFDPEVSPCLDLLEGMSVQIVIALRSSLRGSGDLDLDAFLGALPGGPTDGLDPALNPIGEREAHVGRWAGSLTGGTEEANTAEMKLRRWVSQRLAAPQFFDAEEAKGYLLDNANKLKRLLLSQETAELAKVVHEKAGDFEAEAEQAWLASEGQRRRHGIKQ